MEPVRLIHTAPELPPTIGGVADYTALLSCRLVEVSDGIVEPVMVHAGNRPTESIDVDFPTENLSGRCSASALAESFSRFVEESERTAVLLEYSGYGYDKNGAPQWLADGIEQFCHVSGTPLITVFHELYTSEYRPWKRNFWVIPWQHYVVCQLARLSSGIISNRDDMAQWLHRRVDGTPVRMCPSFSNVGEPDELPPYEDREPFVAHFGGETKKAQLYAEYGSALGPLLQRADVNRIIDIGPPVPEKLRSRVGIPVESKGILSPKEVSRYLRRASLGLLNYPLHCLKKSGIWASYAAHGVPTLLAAKLMGIEGLDRGRHFLLLNEEMSVPKTERRAEISQHVYRWYRMSAHSQRTAQHIGAFISDGL